jgi:hypothetical protein
LSKLHLFHNEEFGPLRGFLDDDGNPWFVAADVCAALNLDNNREAVSSLDHGEKITVSNPDSNPRAGIPHRFTAISEPGLYSLIFRSRKPEAKAFKRWVTHEVIPAIRKTGQYQNSACHSLAVINIPNNSPNPLSYVSTLRQMARLKVYPPLMRAAFLAEAASLLSGHPASRFMPPTTQCPLFH